MLVSAGNVALVFEVSSLLSVVLSAESLPVGDSSKVGDTCEVGAVAKGVVTEGVVSVTDGDVEVGCKAFSISDTNCLLLSESLLISFPFPAAAREGIGGPL